MNVKCSAVDNEDNNNNATKMVCKKNASENDGPHKGCLIIKHDLA